MSASNAPIARHDSLKNHNHALRQRTLLLATVAALASATQSHAQTAKSWTGGTDSNWTTGTNWSPAGAPSNSVVTNFALFPSPVPANQPNLAFADNNRRVAWVSFESPSGGYTLSAGTDTVTGTLATLITGASGIQVTNQVSGTTTVGVGLQPASGNMAIALGSTGHTGSVSSVFNFTGPINTIDAGTTPTARTITFTLNVGSTGSSGANTLNVSGPISGTGTVSYAGGGFPSGSSLRNVANVTGVSSYTGPTLISNFGNNFNFSSLSNTGTNSALGSAGQIRFGSGNSSNNAAYTGPATTSDRPILFAGGGIQNFASNGSGPILLTYAGTVVATGGSGPTLQLVGTQTGNNTLAGVINDSVANTAVTRLTKSGTGRWVLTGSNTYSGPTSITGGTLVVSTIGSFASPNSVPSNLGSPTSAVNATLSIGTNSTLSYTGSGETTNRPVSLIGTNGATFDASGTGPLVLTGAIQPTSPIAKTLSLTGSGLGEIQTALTDNGAFTTSVTKAGPGTWTFSGASTHTGPTTVSAGTLNLSGSLTGSTVTVANGAAFLQDPASVISGSAGVTNSGTLTFSGVNTFTGPVTILRNTANVASLNNVAGTLPASSLGVPAPGNATITIGSGNFAVLNYTGTGETSDRPLQLGNGQGGSGSVFLQQNGTGTLRLTGAITHTGNQFNRNVVLSGNTSGDGVLDTALNDNGTGVITLLKQGTGTWSLNAANINTGNVTISAGTLRLGTGLTTGSISPAVSVNITSTFDGATTSTLTGTLAFNRSDAVNLPNSISGPGHVSHIGTGTTTLSGSVTSTGNFTVSAGKLIASQPLRPVTGSLVVTGPGATATLAAPASASSYVVVGEFADLTVAASGSVTVPIDPARAANKAHVLITGGVSVLTGGVIDLGNGDMIARNTSGSSLASLAVSGGLIASGASVATYTGLAIFSNNAGGGVPFFDTYFGVPLTAADTLVRYDYLGDTNLDGTLNGTDLAQVLEGYSTGQSGWAWGDYNYDGTVSAAEVNKIFEAFIALGGASLGNGQGGADTGGAVPEPASLGLLMALAPLAGRRRR